MNGFLEKAASACLLLLILVFPAAVFLGISFYEVPAGAPNNRPQPSRAGFHELERPPMPPGGNCVEFCHVELPHFNDNIRSAFLNLHIPTIDCGVCHFAGKDLSYRWFSGERIWNAESLSNLSEEAWTKIYAAVKKNGKFIRQEGLSSGREIVTDEKAKKCKECHARKGLITSDKKLFDSFRRSKLVRPPGLWVEYL